MKRTTAMLVAAAFVAATTSVTPAQSVPDPNVDVQMATFAGGACGAWVDQLVTPVVAAEGVQAGEVVAGPTRLCLRSRNGAATLDARAFDVVDTETGCSIGEALLDPTCGSGAGELARDVRVRVGFGRCDRPASNVAGRTLHRLQREAIALGRIEAGRVRCVELTVAYEPQTSSAARSNTDRVQWRFGFTATAA